MKAMQKGKAGTRGVPDGSGPDGRGATGRQSPPQKPKRADFDTDEAFFKALARWRAATRAQKSMVIVSPVEAELLKAKSGDSEYINKDKTFKGGFAGCVRYQKEKKGLSEKSARKLCAYIGRRAGKIP